MENSLDDLENYGHQMKNEYQQLHSLLGSAGTSQKMAEYIVKDLK